MDTERKENRGVLEREGERDVQQVLDDASRGREVGRSTEKDNKKEVHDREGEKEK